MDFKIEHNTIFLFLLLLFSLLIYVLFLHNVFVIFFEGHLYVYQAKQVFFSRELV